MVPRVSDGAQVGLDVSTTVQVREAAQIGVQHAQKTSEVGELAARRRYSRVEAKSGHQLATLPVEQYWQPRCHHTFRQHLVHSSR